MHLPYNNTSTSDFTISYLFVSQNGTPAAAFDAGTAIHVSWESSGDYFNLYAGNQQHPLHSGTDNSFLISQGFLVDTTLTLEATYNGNTLYKSVTVTINNPTLKPSSITVASDNTVNKDMTVNGDVTCNQINVTGKTTVWGLSADNTTSKEVEIGNKLTVNTGTVSLFNESNIIYQGQDVFTNKQFTAHTDGYFIAYLPTYDVPLMYGFSTSITIQMNSFTFKATGGITWVSRANSGVICLPLAKGTSLTYSTTYQSPFFVKAPKAFTLQWYPIGISTGKKETYELIDLPTSPVETPSIDMAARGAAKKAASLSAANSFIQTIEQSCNKTIDATTKQLLVEKLLAFR